MTPLMMLRPPALVTGMHLGIGGSIRGFRGSSKCVL